MIRRGKYAVDKVEYPDGIGCCLWYIIDEKNPDNGLCWDFDYKDLDIIIELLTKLKKCRAKEYRTNVNTRRKNTTKLKTTKPTIYKA